MTIIGILAHVFVTIYNFKLFEHFYTKNMHEYLIQFKNIYELYPFFLTDFLGQNFPIPLGQNMSQRSKSCNNPNFYSTNMHQYP